jgi:hypothetical protein
MVWKPDVSSASAPEAALANFVTPAVAAPPVGAQPVDTDASLQANRSPTMQPNDLPHAFFRSLTGSCEREDPSRIPNPCQCTLAPEPIAVSACEPMPTSFPGIDEKPLLFVNLEHQQKGCGTIKGKPQIVVLRDAYRIHTPMAVQSPPEPTRPQLAESVATPDDLGRRCKARPQPRPNPPLYPPPKHLFGT